MQFQNVIYKKENQVAVIKFNRPKAFNAVNVELFNDIIKTLEIAADDRDVKVIVFTGEGKAFCAGGDVALFESSPDISETLRQLTKLLHFAIVGIRRTSKPVIAMINGATAGAGVSLAAACDLRICASSVKFRQAYTAIGLIPDGAWTLLVPLLVGFGKASELVYLNPTFDAREALQMGLVNKVVDDTELEKTTMDMATRIASGPMISYSIIKENLNNAFFGMLERQLELERRGLIWVSKTADAKEGISSFIEKRKPNFKGQ
ncbi:MAG TPA: enoyl-CoA hydratase-related protein [Syntrophales bacterium]|nr:enoyl-CoA hydratase-related protein [Syntrophales bacterium]